MHLGHQEPVNVYKPLAFNSQNITPKVEDNTKSFIAGREEELSIYQAALKNWMHGIPSVVIITGLSGYGKSALANHVRENHLKEFSDTRSIYWFVLS